MRRRSPEAPSLLAALVLLQAALAVVACTYPEDDAPDPRPSASDLRFQLAGTLPPPGETGVARAGAIDLFFDGPPDGETVTPLRVRLFSGLYETLGSLRVSLLDRRIRLTPSQPLREHLRYQVRLSDELRGLNGARLEQGVSFDFSTGSAMGAGPAAEGPSPTAANLQGLWQQHCTRCHGAKTPPLSLDLSSPARVVTSLVNVTASEGRLKRVLPGDHSRGLLMRKLLGQGVGLIGLPMPPDAPRLGETDLRAIAAWIDGGARP